MRILKQFNPVVVKLHEMSICFFIAIYHILCFLLNNLLLKKVVGQMKISTFQNQGVFHWNTNKSITLYVTRIWFKKSKGLIAIIRKHIFIVPQLNTRNYKNEMTVKNACFFCTVVKTCVALYTAITAPLSKLRLKEITIVHSVVWWR